MMPHKTRTGSCGKYLLLCTVLLLVAGAVHAAPVTMATQAEPAVYLDFNEGSGTTVLDASGHGNAGTIAGATRTVSGGCGGALLFNGTDDYVSVPYSTLNHPAKEITASTWFYIDAYGPQTLVSTYRDNGGYRLGFGDGNDLWWSVSTENGVFSVPVQHEGITPREWHYVAGTYDGKTAKIYLDGVLRNQMNVTGQIQYEYNNYMILGADAGTGVSPDPACPHFLNGGLDEVRIYGTALDYSQVMDDRFRCSAEPGVLPQERPNATAVLPACSTSSGAVHITTGETAYRTLVFSNITENGTWQVSLPRGSKLIVSAHDLYSSSYPDAWYIEIADEKGRIDRSIAFPNTRNTPIEGVIPSGNATVKIRYFDGKYRFPASVVVQFDCEAPPAAPPAVTPVNNILTNPGIVIYSASWATLIAVAVVIIWLHRRRSQEKEKSGDRKE
jgi:hypothetical protein